MATIKVPAKVESVINYDAEADVLYISFGNPGKAEGIDIGDGTILRVNPDTGEVIGITLLDFKRRAESKEVS